MHAHIHIVPRRDGDVPDPRGGIRWVIPEKADYWTPEAVTAVEPQQQLQFLSNIQRLLSEGQFTATYKYALLLAIADICVEDGEDNGAPFVIHTNKIAEKFIAYYWPHVRPYEGVVLRQNTGNTPAVISALSQFAQRGVVTLHEIRRDASAWRGLVQTVDHVVRGMPLWRLQIVGNAATGIPL